MAKIHLSVIIPAYNEEKNIAQTLKRLTRYLKRMPYGFEIIVISDGSTDKTVENAQTFDPHLILSLIHI